ncbi:hypothetical protein ACFWGU_35255, partial [Streptomyces goshikiensis]
MNSPHPPPPGDTAPPPDTPSRPTATPPRETAPGPTTARSGDTAPAAATPPGSPTAPTTPVPATAHSGEAVPGGRAGAVRLTWVQPEDLIGHELRQAAEDGRDPEPARRVWLAAGGHEAPARAGASPAPAAPELRALAVRLLTDLAALPSPSAAAEPQSWP